MSKFKELTAKMFNKIKGASNKNILVWSVIFLLMPFASSYLCLGLIKLSHLVATLAISAAGWMVSAMASISWPIDQITNFMLSPVASFIMLACLPLAAILGASVLIKTRGQNLSALFVTSMGLALSYAFIFMA